MPDLKTICKPCPNVPNLLKPRKLINRLPDLDMWVVCEDGKVETTQEELMNLLDNYNIRTSDVNPILTIDDISKISKALKSGVMPEIFLPIDTHIIEYSKIKELIEKVPDILSQAKNENIQPYLPINPKSYRKQWQYDDEAYNYIYDYLSAFTEYNFTEELQDSLDRSRLKISSEFSEDELFNFLLSSATQANFRRFQSIELEDFFKKRIQNWKKIQEKNDREKQAYDKNISGIIVDLDSDDFQL